MKSVLIRTGSVQQPLYRTGSIKAAALPRHDSITGAVFSGERNDGSPKVLSLHLGNKSGNIEGTNSGIRRAVSESDIHGSEKIKQSRLTGAGSRSFPARIAEDDDGELDGLNSIGILSEIGFFGGGRSYGHGGYSGGGDGNRKMGDYYKEMLKSNPGNSLLLRNYAKFLHEVEGDLERAEELYGRAILASPGDGEVLSLYGKLIWESQRDGDRAKFYFDQAVSASPHDCMVMGSYAQFMWETEEEDEEAESLSPSAVTAVAALFGDADLIHKIN